MTDVGPNARMALAQYRRRAVVYDRRTRRIERYRRRAVERLLLSGGDTVVDVACGTGNNFALLEQYVGPTGRLIGVDLSPEMLAYARARVKESGWRNVALIESAADHLRLDVEADAALFSFTHDVLQSEVAIAAVMATLRTNARVCAVGAKWAPWWALPVNVGVWFASRPFITTFAGLARPWAGFEAYVEDLTVESVAFGGAYIAGGTVADPMGGDPAGQSVSRWRSGAAAKHCAQPREQK